ncbi:hypothetical protein HY838_01110 [Candidatus Azambacteria bacterium]|nr:hypothetical protein [Candidatus Azambacteria bacterium]
MKKYKKFLAFFWERRRCIFTLLLAAAVFVSGFKSALWLEGYKSLKREVIQLRGQLDKCEKARSKKPAPPVAKKAAPAPKKLIKPAAKYVEPPAAKKAAPVAKKAAPIIPATIPPHTLRLNVVEWSDSLSGESRKIGPAIRKGLADGSVKRASAPIRFRIEWRQGAARLAGKTIMVNGEKKTLPSNFADGGAIEVLVRSGQATIELDASAIGPETVLVVHPPRDARLASPPDELPLITTPGELEGQISKGFQVINFNFVLSPGKRANTYSPSYKGPPYTLAPDGQ